MEGRTPHEILSVDRVRESNLPNHCVFIQFWEIMSNTMVFYVIFLATLSGTLGAGGGRPTPL